MWNLFRFVYIHNFIKIWILVGLLAKATECCPQIGTVDPSLHTANIGSTTNGQAFFQNQIAATCCGKLSTFRFYANAAGTVTAMVWRPQTGNDYKLIYKEDFTAPAPGQASFTPTGTVPIIKVGDRVGWKTASNELITYSTTGTSDTRQQLLATTNLNTTSSWGVASLDTSFTYAFGAVVTPNVVPTVTGATVTIQDTQTSTAIHPVVIADSDTIPITNLNVALAPTTQFSIAASGSTFQISSGASLTVGTYPLTVTATDECGQSGTATVTVIVESQKPVFNPAPATVYSTSVSDAQITAVPLQTFTVVDTDAVTCTVNDTLFTIDQSSAPIFSMSFNPTTAASLNYDTAVSHTVLVVCTSGGDSINFSYTVNILDAVPVISGLTGTPSIGDLSPVASDVSTFTVTDQDDEVECSASSPFTITALNDGSAGTQVFQIKTGTTLNEDTATSYNVQITCTDGRNPNITGTLSVDITDDKPALTGLPAATTTPITNGPQTGQTLHTFTVADTNDQASNIACVVDPPNNTSFTIDGSTSPNFVIKTINGASISGTSSISVGITCKDDEAANVVTGIYTVNLANSGPAFVNLNTGAPSISESTTTKSLLYTFTATDTSELFCYTTMSVATSGISLEKGTVTLPNTVYNIYGENSGGFDFEGSSGSMPIQITCSDNSLTVTDTITLTITNSGPTILNTGGSTTVNEGDASTMTLKTLNIAAYDAGDATCTMTNNDGGPFTVNGLNIVKTATALDYETKTTYSLTVECVDPSGLKSTDTFTVNVGNKGPEINELNYGMSIQEDTVDPLALLAITTSDPANSCYQVNNAEPEFTVKFEPSTNKWTVYYIGQGPAGKRLDDEVKSSYDIVVQCKDANGAVGAAKTLKVTVVPNAAPVLTMADNHVEIVKAKAVNDGDVVYTLTTTDAENNDVTIKLVSCEPSATCPFKINGNTVTSTSKLYAHPESMYTLKIEVEDKYNENVPTKDLVILIDDINVVPEFTNIPTYDVVGVNENNAAGAVVFNASVKDPDVDDPTIGDKLTFSCDFKDGGEVYFTCDPTTGEIRAINPINYEAMSQLEFDVEISVTDGYNTTVAPKYVILTINDVNEQPTFKQPTWTLSKADEGKNGDTVGCPAFSDQIDDQDLFTNGEYFTYTMDCGKGNGVFQMKPLTGCVTMTREWDLDAADKGASETIACTVTATDHEGLQTTTSLNIVINDGDDNPPLFSQTSYTFCATVNTTSGNLGTVTATDDDQTAANRDIEYDFPGGGPAQLNGNTLTYSGLENQPVGTTVKTSIRATDKAGNTETVDVFIVVCNPTTNTNNNNNNNNSSSSSSSDNMLLWLIPLILLGLLLLGLLGFLLWRYCRGKNFCKRKVVRKTVVRKQPVRQIVVREEKKPPSTLANMRLEMTRHYARNTTNMFASNHVM
ncbi:hypothetical protein ACF0H5_022902 [Mactra antiquata]